MKLLLSIVAFIAMTSSVFSQISYFQTSAGQYNYDSNYDPNDLVFYLYGDGYYNFEHDNSHEYGLHIDGGNPADVRAFVKNPYTNGNPALLSIHNPTDGISNAAIPQYTLDNMVDLKTSWNLVNGLTDYYILEFENNRSSSPISGCVEFHYHTNQLNITVPDIEDEYGNHWVSTTPSVQNSSYSNVNQMFSWQFENLAYGEQRFVYIPASVLAPSMARVSTIAVMNINEDRNYCGTIHTIGGGDTPDGNSPSVNNSAFYTLNKRVSNFPHDPNMIETYPNCFNSVLANDETNTIRYKVTFQNEGEDPAINVWLDYIFQHPVVSISVVGASHSGFLDWSPSGSPYRPPTDILFTYPNIYLPGLMQKTNDSYEKTIGWVEFDVCFDPEVYLSQGLNCAASSVEIRFDNMPPVIATNEICGTTGPISVSATANCYPDLEFNKGCNESADISEYQDYEGGNQPTIVFLREREEILISELKGDFKIFPNPANDLVRLSNVDFELVKSIDIFDMHNRLIKQFNSIEAEQGMSVSEMHNGFYIISVRYQNSVKTKTFVKI